MHAMGAPALIVARFPCSTCDVFRVRMVVKPSRPPMLHGALEHLSNNHPYSALKVHPTPHAPFTMKVNLVLSMRLAQALAGLVAFNVSGNLHIEGAGHVDDSRTIWPIVTSTVSVLSHVPRYIIRHVSVTPVQPPGGRNVVRFCFTTLEAKAELEHDFLQAIDVWMDALGGPASSRTGHNLVFKEVRTPEGEDTVCCSEWKLPPAQNPCTWNAEVENDVLAVYMNPSGKANSATIGYVSDSDALLNNFPPQRHFVNLKPLNSNINVLWEWVHEVRNAFT